MERSEKELRPYAEAFLEHLEHWCDIDLYSVNHYSTLFFETEEDLKEYTARLRRLLITTAWTRLNGQRIVALAVKRHLKSLKIITKSSAVHWTNQGNDDDN